MKNCIETDIIVIGSGLAGLTFALKASKKAKVAVITKGELKESATYYAQGGIATVLDGSDSFDDHIEDTIKAGGGLSDPLVVDSVIRKGPQMIRELTALGADFTLKEGSENDLDLTIEGGHSKRRIVHAKDVTGQIIEKTLINAVKACENIEIFEDFTAIDLINDLKVKRQGGNDHIWGVYCLNNKTGEVVTFSAPTTVMASGGAGKTYLFTSNPDIASGDGIAMAYRAGAEIKNMEFVQFHPTCLYHSKAKSFLITEAVRGEGGKLILENGERFMDGYDDAAELAPRDIVARAIDFELKKRGDDCVYLDITHKGADFIKSHFPSIYEKCLSYAIDITKEPIPVVPAAHYVCGGIKTDLDGKSTLGNLYAIGECGCTGLHGANRLASNSLLECLVLADNAAAKILSEIDTKPKDLPVIPKWSSEGTVPSDEAVVITQNWDEIRRYMWNYVGIVRSTKRLLRAKRRTQMLKSEINEYYWNFTITSDIIELRNLADMADIIIESALKRKESRGLHYNTDYPKKDDKNFKKDTIVKKEL